MLNQAAVKDFKGLRLLITGGTGSFGSTVIKALLPYDLKEIRVFSRDEKKQDDLRKKYQSNTLSFYLGDVRDPNSIEEAMDGVDFVFHAAALKQVPSCEYFPLEAVKTNVLGTSNVIQMALKKRIKKIVCLSTDKAVYPINAMGISKAMMEKVVVAHSRQLAKENLTTLCATRYGNVMASRGSVIPLFIQQIKSGTPITITDQNMTRFMMCLDEAVSLVLYAFNNGKNGDIFVQKSPAASVLQVAEALKKLLNKPNHPIKFIGTRHGEKKHETLVTKEEMAKAIDEKNYFRIPPDVRDLNYADFYEQGEDISDKIVEYNSENTKRLNDNELLNMLKNLPEIQEDLNF